MVVKVKNQSKLNTEDSVLWLVERIALLLTEAGMPRMPARVFAYVLVEDAERYTAGELSAGLRVSPAAVSGALRYLVQTGLLGKEREPGVRSDHYRIYDDDIWGTIYFQRGPILARWVESMGEGIELLGSDSPGGRRLRETQAFFQYLGSEFPKLLEGWREHRRTLVADDMEGGA